jgi:hypothetical protein
VCPVLSPPDAARLAMPFPAPVRRVSEVDGACIRCGFEPQALLVTSRFGIGRVRNPARSLRTLKLLLPLRPKTGYTGTERRSRRLNAERIHTTLVWGGTPTSSGWTAVYSLSVRCWGDSRRPGGHRWRCLAHRPPLVQVVRARTGHQASAVRSPL